MRFLHTVIWLLACFVWAKRESSVSIQAALSRIQTLPAGRKIGIMLRRRPTRIELKPEDKEEYEQIRSERAVAEAAAAAKAFGGSVMEVEVKLRLPSADAHARIAKLLEQNHEVTHLQENVFFDGVNGELSAHQAILRLRFFNGDDKCIITVKKKTVLENGVGRSEELEDEIEPALGRACVVEPSKLVTAGSSLLNRLVEEYNCTNFKCLGGFKNVRHVYNWNEHKIELDETQYDHGTVYELECESTEPDRLKALLEEFLNSNGISYAYSTSTKFANFKNRTLI